MFITLKKKFFGLLLTIILNGFFVSCIIYSNSYTSYSLMYYMPSLITYIILYSHKMKLPFELTLKQIHKLMSSYY